MLALGGEEQMESGEALRIATDRALRLVFNDRPSLKTTLIYHRRLLPTSRIDVLYHTGGKDITLPLSGSAYSFRVSGCGHFTVTAGGVSHTEQFDSDGCLFRGFTDAGSSIVFGGEHAYTVFGLVTYADVGSADPEDIPDGSEYDVIDMQKRCGDFLAFSEGARDMRGKPAPEVLLRDGRVLIPRGLGGVFSVSYKRSPILPSSRSEDDEIDLSEEMAPLFPLLVASYLWLEDYPEKSQYYMSLYRDGLAGVKRYNARSVEPEYRDVTGWA